jgi:hypothetical protein
MPPRWLQHILLDVLHPAMARAPLTKIPAARQGMGLLRKSLRAGCAVNCQAIELGQFYS